MQNHLSVNAASEMLERTRRTVKRALRHVPPDSHERGQPRWRLPKIIEALQSSGGPMTSPRGSSGVGTGNALDDLDADLANDRRRLRLFDGFNRAYARMEAERSLAKRRALAISFAPTMIDACIRAYRTHCIADGGFIDVSSRADCMFSHLMDGFGKSCQWSHDQVWEHLIIWEDD